VPDRSARVLFVEDDAGLAGIVVRHLRARGHDARVAGSAEEAIEIVGAGFRPTVVLLDINLPEASGWDLLRSGVLAESTAVAPLVYIVSATQVPPSRLHEFGVAGFLPKPFAMPTLVEIVERSTDEQAAQTNPGGIDVF
jgi:two-component system KDP operon response regulator KdpE